MFIITTFAQGKRSDRHGFLRIVAVCLVLVLALAACGRLLPQPQVEVQ